VADKPYSKEILQCPLLAKYCLTRLITSFGDSNTWAPPQLSFGKM